MIGPISAVGIYSKARFVENATRRRRRRPNKNVMCGEELALFASYPRTGSKIARSRIANSDFIE
jgi:hypothetical protein